MPNIDQSARAMQRLERMSVQDSPIHRLHPLAKLAVTIVYIYLVASVPKYNFAGLFIFLLHPVILFTVSGIRIGTCFYQLRMVLPLVLAVGITNPFFDRDPLFLLHGIPFFGTIAVSGGIVSMITLMLKGVFCLMASFLLAATTPMDALCASLRKIHVPAFIVTLLLLTWRYISVMIDEVYIMTTAYQLRAPGQKGIHISAWGSFLGQLLLRSMDRAQELYNSMLLRGFDGQLRYVSTSAFTARDGAYMATTIILLILCRIVPVVRLLGSLAI